MTSPIVKVTALVLISVVAVDTANSETLMHPASVGLVFGIALSIVLGSIGYTRLSQAVLACFRSSTVPEPAARRYLADLIATRQATRGAGLIMMWVGVVNMMVNLSSSEHLAPASAVLILSAVYATFFAELVLGPLMSGLRGRIVDATDETVSAPSSD
ncbi:MAG: hypothetical protein VX589_00070 [Myxococcota bacterium]|nr:hypothetical protein [Myxococcota bacterium]